MDRRAVEVIVQQHTEHLRDLERLREELLKQRRDPKAVRKQFDLVNRDITEHLQREEAELFPMLAAQLPSDVYAIEELQAEHIAILAAATMLTLALSAEEPDQHVTDAALDFVQLYRRHTNHEQALITRAERRPSKASGA